MGSTSLTTSASGVEGGRDHHPYGAQRSASGTMRTGWTFNGILVNTVFVQNPQPFATF